MGGGGERGLYNYLMNMGFFNVIMNNNIHINSKKYAKHYSIVTSCFVLIIFSVSASTKFIKLNLR
jgi:hypothetical protein